MKAKPFILLLTIFILLAIFGLTSAVVDWGLSYADEGRTSPSGPTLKKSGGYHILADPDPTCKITSLKLTSPKEKEIKQASPSELTVLGVFKEGQVLDLELETEASCASETLTLSNPAHTTFLSSDPDKGQFLVLFKGQLLVQILVNPQKEGLPSRHPVIFVHGLGGHPYDWFPENWSADHPQRGNKAVYFETLTKEPYDYPKEFLHAYKYSNADEDDKTYDNQGDIVKISVGMKDAVDAMADLYYTGCQVDCVDLVGFSLGGIVIRQYLNDHPTDHKVRKAITIASPHRGFGFYILKIG